MFNDIVQSESNKYDLANYLITPPKKLLILEVFDMTLGLVAISCGWG